VTRHDRPVPVTGLGVADSVGTTPAGQAWLAALPSLVRDLADEWELDLGTPWPGGQAAWTAPATTSTGRAVVCKVGWPHDEAAGEAAALRHWDGRGAVRLLRHDRARWAMLLERCSPGTALRDDPAPLVDRLAAGCDVLRRLWAVPAPDPPLSVAEVPRLQDVAAAWAALGERRLAQTGNRYDRGLARDGLALLRTLPHDTDVAVVLHGDANPGNLLLDEGHGWVAIDPKPMLGDPAYDPWPLVTQLGDPFRDPDAGQVLAHRYELAAGLLGQSSPRLLAWSVARAVEMALWQDAHGDAGGAAATFARVRVLADLLD
jgi:streptomycin 6-kinase